MINKADAADPLVIARIRAAEPHSVVVSARTGEGIADVIAALEADLPHPGVPFEALLPYERGDLLNRIHTSGEVEHLEHTGDGHRGPGTGQRRPGRGPRAVPGQLNVARIAASAPGPP